MFARDLCHVLSGNKSVNAVASIGTYTPGGLTLLSVWKILPRKASLESHDLHSLMTQKLRNFSEAVSGKYVLLCKNSPVLQVLSRYGSPIAKCEPDGNGFLFEGNETTNRASQLPTRGDSNGAHIQASVSTYKRFFHCAVAIS